MRFDRSLLAVLLTTSLMTAYAQIWVYPETVEIPPVQPSQTRYTIATEIPGITLPVAATPLGDEAGSLLVVSLQGQVWLVRGGEVAAQPFLDLTGRVTGALGEQGLFTVALEPVAGTPEAPRRMVAAYTEKGTGDLLVTTYPVAPDGLSADRTQERVVLRFQVPEPFHHGGQVAFGPDGMLYVSIGSGESSVEKLYVRPAPTQLLGNPLGKILRIDLAGDPYSVPDDNPFTAASDPAAAAAGAMPEIWALGFRNPWKFTFSPEGRLYVADVGEDRWEEINDVVRGGNYGWPAREAHECMLLPTRPEPVDPECQAAHFIDPLVAYGHLRLDPQGGQSVTGGTFVSDPQLPELAGHYVYADFSTGRIWSYDPTTGRVQLLLETGRAITEVATGSQGQLLLLLLEGRIVRLVHAD